MNSSFENSCLFIWEDESGGGGNGQMSGIYNKNLIKVFQVMKDIEMGNHRFFNQILEYENLMKLLEFERSRYTTNKKKYYLTKQVVNL